MPGEISEVWKSLQEKTQESLKTHFPIEGRQRMLVLNSVRIDDKEDRHDNIRTQEDAKFNKRTWGAPVYGDMSLVDKATGKIINRSEVKLLTLPKPTNRYTYIVDGSEWQVDNLWRLRSGIYALQAQNQKLLAEFNLAKPFFKENRVYVPFDPENKQFKFRYGPTLNTSLYSVLKMLGVQDEEMKKVWGEDIYKVNVSKKPDAEIKSFYDKLSKKGLKSTGSDYDAVASTLTTEFQKTQLLPEVTKAILGKPIDHVNGEALLLASKRILDVARGSIKPDDRDSLIYKKLHSVDDFVPEKLTKPGVKALVRGKIFNNLDRKDKVGDIVSGDFFGKPVREFFSKSMLSRPPKQVNPLEMISNHHVTTIMGGDEGGIKSERAVTGSMKLINPTHFGFLDPIHTPESERTGITLHLPQLVKKVGNDVKAPVYDLKAGKIEWVTPQEMHSSHVALPDQVTWDNEKPKPIADKVKMKDPATHEIVEKPFSDARYLIISPHQLFDSVTNLIPFLQNNQGNRTMMATKQFAQAVALQDREAPLVQVRSGGSAPVSWEKRVGVPWSHTSNFDGKVLQIKTHPENGYAESIVLQDHEGKKHEVQLYNHFPLNDKKSFMNSEVRVKPGDTVTKGQILADSNFTKDGTLSLGTNLRVGYLPYKGYNFEDGIVVSESAAKKLTSSHLHRHTVEVDPQKDHISKEKFRAYASTDNKKLTKDQFDKLGPDGVIRIGSQVKSGDVLVAAVGKREMSAEVSQIVSRLGRKNFDQQDKSAYWDSDHPGEVVKIVRQPNNKGVTVYVRTKEPIEIGDKIVGRHGNKSIVTKILPDHEMPRIGGPDGQHIEVAMNPAGITGRINIGQMLETAAGKIAEKTGQPYMVRNFGGAELDYTHKLKEELKHHGLSDTDTLYDPTTRKALGEVLTGPQYIMKLEHQVEKKLSVRSAGPGANYNIDHAPAKGGEHPGLAIGQLELYALLAHGARANLREMATYKSDEPLDEKMAHTDFWHRVMTGQPLPAPKPTFAYQKFERMLTGLGIDLKKDGNSLVLQPLTDKGILKMSKGEIKDPGRVLRGKDAKELEKGLFDPQITGGLPNAPGKGLFWSHISLAEPLPNPIFVGTKQIPGPAVVLTGMKFADFENVVRGKKYVDGLTGGKAIEAMLKKIDVKQELKKTLAELPKLRDAELNKANRKARYLMALDKLDMKPHEAYVMNHIPVLPPVFRPIVPMKDGSLKFDDINHIYHSLGLVNMQLKDQVKSKDLPDDEHHDLREQLYDLAKTLAGTGAHPVYKSNRKMKGILDTISGEQPKMGYFQSKIMKRQQDLSMRSTIIPEPAMHLDYASIPRDAAMELYKPFVVYELQRSGQDVGAALKEVKAQTPAAWNALNKAMDKRPMFLKRDPALHKYSIMAFKPRLVDGKAIQIHPLVTAAYNADFDGDTMSAFLPLTPEAVAEAHKMFPSNNLFSSTNGGILYAPDHESLLGLHLLSKWGNPSGKTFNTYQDALKARDQGHIGVNDVIAIGGQQTTVGRLMIAEKLPEQFKKNPTFNKLMTDPHFVLVKKTKDDKRIGVHDMLEQIGRNDPKNYPIVVDALKDLGNKHSYDVGYSFSLKDLDVQKHKRDEIMKRHDEAAASVKKSSLSNKDKETELIKIYDKATTEMETSLKPHYAQSGNRIFTMVDSGARGKWEQFRQMNIAPMLVKDGMGNTLSTPVKKSYAEGLDVGDYWTSLHGARMGTLQRVEGTSEPGRLTKEIVNVMVPQLIMSKDCETKQGITMHLDDHDIHGRHLAAAVKSDGRLLADVDHVLTPDTVALLQKNKVGKVLVRSPLKCQHGHGVCAKCYGLNENGAHHEVGTNIGVIAGHALGEPATQLAMDSFHTGGVAASRGGASVDKFVRLKQLLNIPKTLPDAARLAEHDGRVDKIERDTATNGWNIHVAGKLHFSPAQRRPIVAHGEEVRKGQKLTDGNIDPRTLLRLTDINHVQNHLTSELYNVIYKDERVKRRNIETVVRSLTNLTHVKDPGDSEHLTGDLALRTVVEEHNRNLPQGHRPIEHEPIIKGTQQTALDQHEDWMARLNFQRLDQTILEGTAKGWRTNLHGPNPLPAYAHGATFGQGTKKHPHFY